jgi:hypothetical protein
MDSLVRKLNKLRFNSFLLQLKENFMDQNTGVAIFPGAAIESDHLHFISPFFVM